jgi:hypothetical protein
VKIEKLIENDPLPPPKKGTLWLLVDYDNKRSLSLFVAKQYISYER